jgi:hypothetical protein
MILETTQLLSSVHHIYESKSKYLLKLTHKNHPCSIWARHSISNYKWLSNLGLELCREYTHRYNKKHRLEDNIVWLSKNTPKIKNVDFCYPPACMDDEYKKNNVIESYKNYYLKCKYKFCWWTKRDIPDWFLGDRSIIDCITTVKAMKEYIRNHNINIKINNVKKYNFEEIRYIILNL